MVSGIVYAHRPPPHTSRIADRARGLWKSHVSWVDGDVLGEVRRLRNPRERRQVQDLRRWDRAPLRATGCVAEPHARPAGLRRPERPAVLVAGRDGGGTGEAMAMARGSSRTTLDAAALLSGALIRRLLSCPFGEPFVWVCRWRGRSV